MKIIPGAMHVCHTILVRGNHYQRKTMKDESSNVLIAVILGYLEFFIFFFSFFERLGKYFGPPTRDRGGAPLRLSDCRTRPSLYDMRLTMCYPAASGRRYVAQIARRDRSRVSYNCMCPRQRFSRYQKPFFSCIYSQLM